MRRYPCWTRATLSSALSALAEERCPIVAERRERLARRACRPRRIQACLPNPEVQTRASRRADRVHVGVGDRRSQQPGLQQREQSKRTPSRRSALSARVQRRARAWPAHYIPWSSTVGVTCWCCMSDDASDATGSLTQPLIDQRVANHREFLQFVERRIGNRALAEEIVQDAFVRSLDRGDEIRDSVLGWFYRVLRNAIIDRRRRQAVADRRLDEFAAELESGGDGGEELAGVVCRCVGQLADTLKPEYADALRRIEIEGVPVKDYADAAGITANNAGVRIFRARDALRKQVARSCGTCAEHGCLDCTCDT